MTELDVMHTLGACPSMIIIPRRDEARACLGLRDQSDVFVYRVFRAIGIFKRARRVSVSGHGGGVKSAWAAERKVMLSVFGLTGSTSHRALPLKFVIKTRATLCVDAFQKHGFISTATDRSVP